MNLKISIPLDTASPMLRKFAGMKERAPELNEAMGGEALKVSKNYLTEYSATHPNQLGGPRSDYWSHAADDAFLTADAHAATLNFPTPGIGRALHDVTITPGTKTSGVKNLTFPAIPQAYNRRAAGVSGLAVFWGKGRAMGLKEGEQKTRTRNTKGGAKGSTYWAPRAGGLVWYWFAKSAFQPQKRELLPSNEQLQKASIDGAIVFVNKLLTEVKR
jgi:hypothetical protein